MGADEADELDLAQDGRKGDGSERSTTATEP